MQPSVFQIAFSSIKGMSREVAESILAVVGSEERFFLLSEKELQECCRLSNKIFSESYRNGLLERAEHELAYIEDKGIDALYFTDDGYPVRFLTASDAPLLLYQKGTCDLNAKKVVAIVGTRHATGYGIGLCRELVHGLKALLGKEVVIVSGLAYGIDITAHTAALDAGLPTIAVMAHGLDMVYPAQHRSIAVDMVRGNGAVITEYPSNTRIHRSNFLARNRIVAALADCTVVVESAVKGGALVTANIASSYGRDVFAFPGRLTDEFSEGCNRLINKNVATLVSSAGDLADAMRWERISQAPKQQELFVNLTDDELHICNLLGSKNMHINELGMVLGLPVHKLLSMLVDLEFKGVVMSVPGNKYELVKKI